MTTKTSNNGARAVDLESLAEIHPDACSSSNFLDPEFERRFETVGDFLKSCTKGQKYGSTSVFAGTLRETKTEKRTTHDWRFCYSERESTFQCG